MEKDDRRKTSQDFQSICKEKKNLQEVVRSAARDVGFASAGSRIKLEEGIFEMLIDFHDSCLVTASVAVVRSREDGNDILLMDPTITLDNKLVRTSDQS